ncbi:WD40 repeat domain-containing protein [Paenibacillus wulumuqiensis]|uniref:WD40 repeat domain-containing protein n=1 Tax=Paenibacillus wulumuqiensis TaxID=1567107 RepID=UPI000A5BB8CB|nr:WD40 repeat domain-containing protein [Paenibacillus wulumuqiensis]
MIDFRKFTARRPPSSRRYGLTKAGSISSMMLALMLLLGGCGSDSVTTGSGEQQLTVIQDDSAAAGKQPTVMLSSVDKLDHVYARTWLSADELLLNKNDRLLVHHLSTRQSTPLTPERKAPQYLAEASPDGRHVYFTEGQADDKYVIHGYILDRDTDKVTPIGDMDMVNEIRWADNEQLIAGSPKTGVRLIDLQGKSTLLKFREPHPTEGISHVEKVGDRIYYLASDGQGYTTLNRFTTADLQATVVASNVADFSVSPDGQSIVIQQVKWNTSEPFRLIVMDASGKVKGSVGEGTLLGRPAWSPDGELLAFTIYQESQQGLKGLYIFDQRTGKTIPLTSEIQGYNESIRWSPDGDHLSVYMEDQQVVTDIVGIIR